MFIFNHFIFYILKEDHLDVSALRYSCLINLVSEKFKQHDLGDIVNYKNHYSGCNKVQNKYED